MADFEQPTPRAKSHSAKTRKIFFLPPLAKLLLRFRWQHGFFSSVNMSHVHRVICLAQFYMTIRERKDGEIFFHPVRPLLHVMGE